MPYLWSVFLWTALMSQSSSEGADPLPGHDARTATIPGQECDGSDCHDAFRDQHVDSVFGSDLNGKTYRIGTFMRPPFVMFDRHDGEIGHITGFCFEIIQAMQQLYNFSIVVSSPEGTGTGTLLENGTWNGIIGQILADVIVCSPCVCVCDASPLRVNCSTIKAVDLGVGPFSVTSARAKVIDYSVPFYEEPTALLIPSPTQHSRLFACVEPFRSEVWLALVIVLFIQPLAASLHLKLLQRGDGRAVSLYRHCEIAYGVLLMQSGRRIPRIGFGLRLAYSVWCLSVVVIIHAYIGTLMASLTMPKFFPLVNSIEDLPRSPLKCWMVKSGTSLESLFMEAKGGIFEEIGGGLRRHSSTSSLRNDSIVPHRVIDGNCAYINGRSVLEFFIGKDYSDSGKCRMAIAKKEFYKVNSAFVLPKGSALRHTFNRKILQMTQTGLMRYWQKKHWPSIDPCSRNDRNKERRILTLTDLQSGFIILGIGLGLALMAFIGEVVNAAFAKVS